MNNFLIVGNYTLVSEKRNGLGQNFSDGKGIKGYLTVTNGGRMLFQFEDNGGNLQKISEIIDVCNEGNDGEVAIGVFGIDEVVYTFVK